MLIALLVGTGAATILAPGTAEGQAGPRARQDAGDAVQVGGDELRLELSDAVRLAFRNNLDIAVVDYDRVMARESVTSARGAFDPQLFVGTPTSPTLIRPPGGGFGGGGTPGGFGFSSTEEPAASQLAGADVSTSENFGLLLDFGQQLPFGLRYDIGYGVSRSLTNSAFSSLNPSFSNVLTFSVAQPLLRGFGREATAAELRLARRNVEVSDAAFRTQVETILLQVEEAYWEQVFAERNLEVQRETLELAREQLERTRAQVEVGYLPEVQVTQAEVAVAERESELIVARNQLESARDRLRALLGTDRLSRGWETRVVATQAPEYRPVDVRLERVMERAMESRPELRRARAEIRARGVEVASARNGKLPRLDVVGSVTSTGIGGDLIQRDGFFGPVVGIEEGGYGDAASQLLEFDFINWQVGLTLSYPIFNRTAEANYARATLAEDRAKTELRRLEEQVSLEVRQAVRDLEATAERVEATRKARELAERQLEIEEERFEVGLSTNFEVLEFQEDLSRARTAELRALVDHEIARASIRRVAGTLLSRFGIELQGLEAGESEGKK